MPTKFRVLGGGVGVFWRGGGWKCQFYLYGRGEFSEILKSQLHFEIVKCKIASFSAEIAGKLPDKIGEKSL